MKFYVALGVGRNSELGLEFLLPKTQQYVK